MCGTWNRPPTSVCPNRWTCAGCC
ncbi:hypothetical protein IU449_27455 [Nocardia higoensis]|uniref:Uncharacterized protein n=1 Tax=Nocardia higoensis TaxID=228599 RepID=A0ABS0DIE7_9NOCA|nr:hypothetical protein [Nocardia higoensis]